MANTSEEIIKITLDTGSGEVKINGIASSLRNARSEVKRFADAQKEMGKAMDKGRDKTGLAGAAVAELGRTISDANYGFTAIANNISQFATLFTTLISTTDGFKDALKEMGKALTGPLGIIVLFQIVVTLFERVAMNSKKADDSLKNIASSANQAGVDLKVLKDAINDENTSLEEKNEILDAANEKYKELNLQLGENGKLTDESVVAIDNKIDALMRLAKANAIMKEIEKIYGELAALETEDSNAFLEYVNQAAENMQMAGVDTMGAGFLADTLIGTKGEQAKELTERLNGLKELLKGDGLVDLIFAGDTKGVKTKLEKVRKLIVETAGTTHEQAKERIEQADTIFEQLVGLSTADAATEQLKASATKAIGELASLVGLDTEEKLKDYEEQKRLDQARIESDAYLYQKKLDGQAEFLKASAELSQEFVSFLDAGFQAELDAEQNKTNALNNQLKERLRNEQLTTDERKKIQNQIAKNDEELRKKQEEIEKKRFKMQQAANISQALVETYLAAAKALKNGGGAPTGLPAMFATIAAGMLQVASIAKQKFQTSAAAMTGGVTNVDTGDGGGALAGPSFNVVGQSGSNQLARAVSGQLSKPIKAYVVSKDVSTAQEMDRNVVKTASLG